MGRGLGLSNREEPCLGAVGATQIGCLKRGWTKLRKDVVDCKTDYVVGRVFSDLNNLTSLLIVFFNVVT